MMEGCDEEYIVFTLEDREGVTFTYEDTFIITTMMEVWLLFTISLLYIYIYLMINALKYIKSISKLFRVKKSDPLPGWFKGYL